MKSDDVRDTAEAIKGIVEAVPVYQDVVQPAAREVGTALQTVAKTVHIALAPISAMVWGFEQIKEYVNRRVSEKLKDVPPESIITPPPHVAGPAIEAMRFTADEPNLRELYATLLATSMDTRAAKSVHPSFVEIIRQLTSDEAKLLQLLGTKRGPWPLISIRGNVVDVEGSSGGITVLRYFSLLGHQAGCAYPGKAPIYLDNLSRLGLIEIPIGMKYTKPGVYDPLTNRPEVLSLIKQIDNTPNRKSEVDFHALIVTDFGQQFYKACVQSAELGDASAGSTAVAP